MNDHEHQTGISELPLKYSNGTAGSARVLTTLLYAFRIVVGSLLGFELEVGCNVGRAVKSNIGQFELRGQRLSDMPKNDKPIAHRA